MAKIRSLHAREILDSRGNPALEVSCELESGILASASVPSGASTGVHEALELRDQDFKRYNGLGVLKVIDNVQDEISRYLLNKNFDQQTLDKSLVELDGTENKTRLGANAILGVSLSFARACAHEQKIELYRYLGALAGNKNFKLPLPMFNILNGGKHAHNGLDIQEYMIGPVGVETFREKIHACTKIISELKTLLIEHGYSTDIGDEGGFAPALLSNEESFELIEKAIKKADYSFDQIKIGIDVAASSFYKNNTYTLKIDGKQKTLHADEMILWYKTLITKHPLIFIEDGLAQDDWDGFSKLVLKLGKEITIVGDDLTVTNPRRIKMAIEKNAVNSVIIKMNQIGTLTETLEAVQMTKKQGWLAFASHRSGETNDTFVADLAVGFSCDYIKSGSLTQKERIVKYNRLIEIEESLEKSKSL